MSHKEFIKVGKEKVEVPFLMKNGQKELWILKKFQQNPTKKEKEPKPKGSHIMTTSGLALPC